MADRAQRAIRAKLANGLVRICPDPYCKTVAFVIVDACPECGTHGVRSELGVRVHDPAAADTVRYVDEDKQREEQEFLDWYGR